MAGQTITGETLVGLLEHIRTPWVSEITEGDGNLIVNMGEGHIIFFGNLEGSCSVCHASQELTALAPTLAQEVLDLRAILFEQQNDPFSHKPMMTPEEWKALSAESKAEINRQAFVIRGQIQSLEAEVKRLSQPKIDDAIAPEVEAQGWTLDKIIGLQNKSIEAQDVIERIKYHWQSTMDEAILKMREITDNNADKKPEV